MHNCAGCGIPIDDKFLFKSSDNMEWHMKCLRCNVCHIPLTELGTDTCFIKDRIPYCREHYQTKFGVKCAGCLLPLDRNDLVMKTKAKIFHTECFRCTICSSKLQQGDQFLLRDEREILCRAHFIDHEAAIQEKLIFNAKSEELNENEDLKNSRILKSTRMRTVLNEKQLTILKACYNTNPRPDAIMKEQLVELTGLPPRVIRVWFQNKRCKDKKKSLTNRDYFTQSKGTTNNSNDNKPSTTTPTTPRTTYMGDNSLLFYQEPSQHLTRTTSYKSTTDWSQEAELTLSQSMDVRNFVEMARIWHNKCQHLWYPPESNSEESVSTC